jgi:hypothetical protein
LGRGITTVLASFFALRDLYYSWCRSYCSTFISISLLDCYSSDLGIVGSGITYQLYPYSESCYLVERYTCSAISKHNEEDWLSSLFVAECT